MCNFINIHTYIHTYIHNTANAHQSAVKVVAGEAGISCAAIQPINTISRTVLKQD